MVIKIGKFLASINLKSKIRLFPIKIDEDLVSSGKELVNIFSAYFASVFSEEIE